ncbi:MAG: ferrochelatase [Gemmatimonadetes bacterium]|nr:ferrochelatase [Gemmatimonadota bacterium]
MSEWPTARAAVLLLNFGEPEVAEEHTVVPYLERIFSANAELDDELPETERRARSRMLAERRAAGLVEEYRTIGGSPLNRQAQAQARALEEELERRGHRVRCYVGMQFTDPLIDDAARCAIQDQPERVIALPTYPLCGPSTTLAALRSLQAALHALGARVPVHEVTGWHRHPDYIRVRADAIRRVLEEARAAQPGRRTLLVFSAHGTPLKYLQAGSRYDEYVHDCCRLVAAELGLPEYAIGYQNHGARGIQWTQPEIGEVIRTAKADAVVVDAISFMHEQSETLSELDVELKEAAEAAGLAFYRVPVPHDDPRFAAVLADLAEPFLEGTSAARLGLRSCACRTHSGALCLNRCVDGPGAQDAVP